MEEQTTLSMKMEEAKFGKMLIFNFDIKGVEVSALCSQKLNPKTKLFDWVKILTGKAPVVGEDLVIKDLVGKEALVTVRNRIVKDEKGNASMKDGKNILTSGITEIRETK